MIRLPRIESNTVPALLLVAGRTFGFAASFAIPIVLVRVFTRAEFGTYKQVFLIYGTLFGLAQLGMAESLYYFVPRKPNEAGRHVTNAIASLGLIGVICVVLLWLMRTRIASWMSNAELAYELVPAGIFLGLMLVSVAFEIVLVSRKRHATAAGVYAASDVARTLFLIVPALLFRNLHALLLGAVGFAAVRVVAMIVSFWREFGHDLRVEMGPCRQQLAYALPFALAVGIEVVQTNYHQYVVASRFDPATFAIYAVGCLQIPLVDLIASSSSTVMMVRLAEDTHDGPAALALWHETICWLAALMFPMAVFLLITAHEVIVALFTKAYVASVPIFMMWSLTILPSAFAVDSVLRAYAQTRFLLIMNVLRLAMVAFLIGWCLKLFGLSGAVLITLLSTSLTRALGILKIATLTGVRFRAVLPWKRLAGIAVCSSVAAIPAVWIMRSLPIAPLAEACVVYGLAYALLRLASGRLQAGPIPVPLLLRRRLSAAFTEES